MSKLKALAGAATLIAVMGVTMGSGASNDAASVDESSSPAAAAGSGDSGSKSKTFKVGETVKLGDWRIKVSKVTDPLKPKNEFMTPEKGMRWVRVDATVTNNSDEPQTVSSIACFDVRDSESRKYTITIVGDSSSQLDGEVAPGEKLRGNVDFEVKKAAKGLTLHFKCDFLSSGTAQIKLTK